MHSLTVPVNSATEAVYMACSNTGGIGSILTVTMVESRRDGVPSSYKRNIMHIHDLIIGAVDIDCQGINVGTAVRVHKS